ncbi:hypothetical protein V0M98_34655 (plasmid) [Pseudomonas silesiensis]|uniref:hypothetical protein n=1 Tax=Pseudomonas silesiensis TaxID=1853130 RepID=UPI0030CA5C60
MAADCTHPVGFIPPGPVESKDWNQKLADFIAVVDDFNVRGQRDQINHPGFVTEFNFCPYCRHPIDRTGLLTYTQAFDHYHAAKAKG